MNDDIDPLLSAYLDGELDDPGRRRVEQATRSDPVLAARLASLTRVHDLVATLSSPPPLVDLSDTIRATIARRKAARSLTLKRAGFAAAGAVPLLAAAAVLLMIFVGPRHDLAPAELRAVPPIAAIQVPPPPPSFPTPASPLPPRPVPSLAPVAVAVPPAVLAAETKASEDRQHLQVMLSRPDVRMISVTVDALGPAAINLMDDAIRTSNFREPEHARVRLIQSVSLDPKRSGPAFVYALVMDDVEHDAFRTKLKTRLHEANLNEEISDEPAPSRDALAMLPAVGQIEIFPGQPRATLRRPPADAIENIAIQRPRNVHQGHAIVKIHPDGPPAVNPPAPRVLIPRAVDAPPADNKFLANRAAPRPAPEAAEDSPSAVYIVLLTAREHRS